MTIPATPTGALAIPSIDGWATAGSNTLFDDAMPGSTNDKGQPGGFNTEFYESPRAAIIAGGAHFGMADGSVHFISDTRSTQSSMRTWAAWPTDKWPKCRRGSMVGRKWTSEAAKLRFYRNAGHSLRLARPTKPKPCSITIIHYPLSSGACVAVCPTTPLPVEAALPSKLTATCYGPRARSRLASYTRYGQRPMDDRLRRGDRKESHVQNDRRGQRGKRRRNGPNLARGTGVASALFLTHAHADHLGRLPLLIDRGFTGPIYMTEATAALAVPAIRVSAIATARPFVIGLVARASHGGGTARPSTSTGATAIPPGDGRRDVEQATARRKIVRPFRQPNSAVEIAPVRRMHRRKLPPFCGTPGVQYGAHGGGAGRSRHFPRRRPHPRRRQRPVRDDW